MKANRINAMVLSALLCAAILAPVTGALAAADENLTPRAVVTTDIPYQTEDEGPQKLSDGKTNTPLLSDGKAAPSFPYHIELDFGGYTASLSDLKLYAIMGKDAGVTDLSVERMIDGRWESIRSGVVLKWDKADSANAEVRTLHFSEPQESGRFRIVIHKANVTENRFRLDELEFWGRLTGVENKLDVKAVHPNYIRAAVGEPLALPKTVTAELKDGATASLNVDWGAASPNAEGIQAVTGVIPFYGLSPVTIVDIFDPQKQTDPEHWAAAAIGDAIKTGLMGGVDCAPQHPLSAYEAALVLFRAAGLSPAVTDEGMGGAAHDPAAPMVQAVIENGLMDAPDDAAQKFSRADAVSAVTRLEQAEKLPVVNSEQPRYSDIAGLSESRRAAVIRAWQTGIVSNADAFRPHDAVTAAELAAMLSKLATSAQAGREGMIERTFADSGEVLVNPYMGIFSYYLDNGLVNYDIHYENGEYFEDVQGLSNIYIRVPWSVIEPEKGLYDFSVVDGAIEKYKRAGKQISLRFTASETGHVYATPKWVFDEGAKVFWWGYDSNKHSYTMPYFDDEIFLKNLDVFLGEVAKRYDGNPNIAYLDVGSLGIWGEGHTGSAGYTLTPDTALKHLELYHKHFKKTKVVVLDDMGQNYNDRFFPEIKDKVIEMGFGLRNDGYAGIDGKMRFILPEDKTLGDGIWEHAPIVMEPEHYKEMQRLDIWGDGMDLAHWIDTVHATYIGLHGFSKQMALENPEFMEYANKRIGYRILPESVRLTAQTRVHGKLALEADWKNVAAAPCYNGAYPAVTLKDADGNIMSVMVDSAFNVKELPVADPGKAKAVRQEAAFRLHDALPGGTYQAFLSLGSITGAPEIKMPIGESDGENRYYIGEVKVAGDYDVTAGEQAPDGSVTLHFAFSPDVGTYSALWGNIALREQDAPQVYMPGDLLIGIDTAPLKAAIGSADTCDITVKLALPEEYKSKPITDKSLLIGKKFDVYFDMDTLADGMTPGMLLSGDGRSPKIGTAVIAEDFSIKFEPLQK